jgi:hypothetical protein
LPTLKLPIREAFLVTRIAVAVLVFVAGIFAVSAKDVTIGNVSTDLTIPSGFCELDGKNPVDVRALTAIRKLVSDAGNQLLVLAADCRQLDDWRIGKRGLLDDIMQYQTPVNLLNKPLPVRPSEFIKQVCALTRSQGEKLLSAVAPDLHSHIEQTLQQVKVNETSLLGVLAEDSTACYAALLQRLRTEVGTDKVQTAVYATTIVRGKVIYCYLFAPYTGAETIGDILAKQKLNVAALIAANKN